MACVVIKDRFGDCHALTLSAPATPEEIRKQAGYIAHNIAIVDDGERVKAGRGAWAHGSTATTSAGASRFAVGPVRSGPWGGD